MKKISYEEIYNIILRSQIYSTYDELLEIVKKNVQALCDNRVKLSVFNVSDVNEMVLYDLIDAWTFSKSIEPWYLLCRTVVIHDEKHSDRIHEIVVEIM